MVHLIVRYISPPRRDRHCAVPTKVVALVLVSRHPAQAAASVAPAVYGDRSAAATCTYSSTWCQKLSY